jgi:hypothetical protein
LFKAKTRLVSNNKEKQKEKEKRNNEFQV